MFNLKSNYIPSKEQQKVIDTLSDYVKKGYKYQTLWWITWSWKTFIMANIIKNIKKPTLVIAHNKTLRAQLAWEFKEFFPDSAVHYFVSYYDYYQPEAYVWKTDTYIEKEATINEEIDRLRHAATQDLIKRKDVIIVASVSCIYWVWDIKAYEDSIFSLEIWEEYVFEELIKMLLLLQYKRAFSDFRPWTFVVSWDLIEIYPSSMETVYSIEFWWNEITDISRRHSITWEVFEKFRKIDIFPAKHTVTTKETINAIIPEIKRELGERLKFYEENWEILKHERLKTKVEYDIEMMQEVWYVNGIENYSRYLDGRNPWEPPATLIDYFWDDFLCLVDESHMTISQIWWMYAWDKARKVNLVEAWFRLPSALDNRPLRFEEFDAKVKNVVLVSATPWDFDIKNSSSNPDYFINYNPIYDWEFIYNEQNRIVPQIIRPTWLLDPKIEFRSMKYMVDDVMKNISDAIDENAKVLITTITKKSSEELCDYLLENNIKVKYLHSEIETLERLEILAELRTWKIDVIVWVNLLREWLDLPEVSKICILDADKQWFLRSVSSLIQIIWRRARNENWTVYMYSEFYHILSFENDSITLTDWRNLKLWDYLLTESGEKENLYIVDKWKYLLNNWLVVSNAMKQAINLTNYRRKLQNEYNLLNNIIPKTVYSKIKESQISKKDIKIDTNNLEKELKRLEFEMQLASSNMEYEKARELRDMIIELKKRK